MRPAVAWRILVAWLSMGWVVGASALEPLRPPAVPLMACDPYFSVWSPADTLTGAETVHWTGKPHRLSGWIRVDDQVFGVMGASPADMPALAQTGLKVWPTRTVYTMQGGGVALELTFLTPALPDDLEVLARPVTYVDFKVRSTDGASHRVAIGFLAGGELAVNTPDQRVRGQVGATASGALRTVAVGSEDQAVLGKRGDDLRIDWGHLWMAGPAEATVSAAVGGRAALTAAFRGTGRMASAGGEGAAMAGEFAAGLVLDAGTVGATPVQRWLMVAYDDLYSIQYMKKNLRPYWRRNGWGPSELLEASAKEREALWARCEALDAELTADLERVGGAGYASLAALAYRQCFAAGKFVADGRGQPLQFCKENHSNGCIATSDVFYPMAPQFLLFGPTLAKSFLVPFMNYAASERWRFPFAPHDLGTYPHANGQVYGGGERTEENQMPVEESGNLLLLMAAVAQMEGNADFASLYWPQLERWAAYLASKGFDPENQLCTDDFAGHLAHNVNLSAKAICGLGAFAKLCEMRGEKAAAGKYRTMAEDFAKRWVRDAADGDTYRLAFDKPGTWSQKYNLVWDRILGLNLFPSEVLRREMAFYRKMQNPYGLPLDNRETYTKLDWILWTATLTGDRADFEALVDPVVRFVNATPDRSPLTDWYQTKTAAKVGFTARPVIGGVFLAMIQDPAMWKKYAARDRTRASGWAPMPIPPRVTPVVSTAREAGSEWKFTLDRPADGWFAEAFPDAAWTTGRGGFGTRGTPGAEVRTEWKTGQIWMRREFDLPAAVLEKRDRLQLLIHHDEDATVYLNGVRIVSLPGYTSDYETVAVSKDALATLRAGRNVLAIHCRQTGGGQYIDAGWVTVEEVAEK